MSLLLIVIIAVSLSMDAFSLALSIGSLAFSKKSCFFLSFVVGVFHFFMPLLGSFLGVTFIKAFHIDVKFLAFVIFLYIAYQMIKEYKSGETSDFPIKLESILIFALGVSLDSFGVGFTIDEKRILTASIFAFFSFSFTYCGLVCGRLLNKLIGKYAIIFGFLIMLVLSFSNLYAFLTN